jgi:hypothetical protein
MPQDKTAELQAQIRSKQNKLSLDNRGMYAILLGRPIVETMIQQLGQDNSDAFLQAHEKFDRALEKSKNIDIFELVPVHELLAFRSFSEYVSLLQRLDAKVKLVKDDDDAKIIHQALTDMLECSVELLVRLQERVGVVLAKLLDHGLDDGSAEQDRVHASVVEAELVLLGPDLSLQLGSFVLWHVVSSLLKAK